MPVIFNLGKSQFDRDSHIQLSVHGSKSNLYPSVKDSPFERGVNFRKSRIGERRQNDGAELALSHIRYVFGVDEEADLPKGLLAEDADQRIRARPRSVCQRLASGVMCFQPSFEVLVFLEDERRVDLVTWR